MTFDKANSGFADRLVRERQRLKLTQHQVAAGTGVSTPTQIGYEQGQRSPPTEYTARLRELGFDVLLLLFDESSADYAADELDWALLGRISVGVQAWCASRKLEMQQEKFGRVLRLLYNEYRRKPFQEHIDVGVVLELLAA